MLKPNVAVGSAGPRPSDLVPAKQELTTLQQIQADMTAVRGLIGQLVERLAPVPLMQEVTFNNVSAGSIASNVTVMGPFNAIIGAPTAGILNVYFGPSMAGLPNFQFNSVYGSQFIPFAPRQDRVITIGNDASAPGPMNGKMYILSY